MGSSSCTMMCASHTVMYVTYFLRGKMTTIEYKLSYLVPYLDTSAGHPLKLLCMNSKKPLPSALWPHLNFRLHVPVNPQFLLQWKKQSMFPYRKVCCITSMWG